MMTPAAAQVTAAARSQNNLRSFTPRGFCIVG
jgi:hypothetical protein